jgi:xanthine/CO dehydrogenase XdhC/CoxF family maturation factor
MPAGSGVFVSDAAPFGGVGASGLESLAQQQRARCSNRFMPRALNGVDVLGLIELPAPRLLLLGAGPDAKPVADLASFMGWSLVVIDHRPHYAQRSRFPDAELVLDGGPATLSRLLQTDTSSTDRFAAAIVMSHHYLSDRSYLAALAQSDIPYIGLLGPAIRRDRLLAQLGSQAAGLRQRLHSPVGLDLGADGPESIALAIAAEIQSVLGKTDEVESLSLEPPSRAISNVKPKPDPVAR